MKKILLTSLMASSLAVAAFGQGTVQWTGVANQFFGQTNSTVYSTFGYNGGVATGSGSQGFTLGNNVANDTSLGYTGYYYELLVSSTSSTAPTSGSGLSSWQDTGLFATNGAASNGRIVQSYDPANATQAVANHWAAGTTENVILVGWSANLGSSWTTVENELQNWSTMGIANSYFGVSSVGSLASGTGNPGVIVFGTGPGQINNISSPMQMDLLAVPEPTSIGLAIAGVGSLLMFRRKK
jgi:hypothetical protein